MSRNSSIQETQEAELTPSPEQTSDVTPEPSSSSDPTGEPSEMLDAVTEALSNAYGDEPQGGDKADDPGKEDTPPSEKNEDGSEKAADDKGEKSQETEDDKPPPFHNHPRWKEVQAERKELKATNAELTDKVQKLEEDLKSYHGDRQFVDQYADFMTQHGLVVEEMNEAAQMAALIKTGRFKEALERLTPIYQGLQQQLGQYLPPDLQQKVEQGLTDLETAKEVAQRRMQISRMEHGQQETTQRNAQQQVQNLQTYAADWERQKSENDPDWGKKQKAIAREVELELLKRQRTGQLPRTAHEVHTLLDGIATKVGEELSALLPKPPRREMRPINSGGTVVPTKREAESYLEAVQFASEDYRAAS